MPWNNMNLKYSKVLWLHINFAWTKYMGLALRRLKIALTHTHTNALCMRIIVGLSVPGIARNSQLFISSISQRLWQTCTISLINCFVVKMQNKWQRRAHAVAQTRPLNYQRSLFVNEIQNLLPSFGYLMGSEKNKNKKMSFFSLPFSGMQNVAYAIKSVRHKKNNCCDITLGKVSINN